MNPLSADKCSNVESSLFSFYFLLQCTRMFTCVTFYIHSTYSSNQHQNSAWIINFYPRYILTSILKQKVQESLFSWTTMSSLLSGTFLHFRIFLHSFSNTFFFISTFSCLFCSLTPLESIFIQTASYRTLTTAYGCWRLKCEWLEIFITFLQVNLNPPL